MDNPPSERSRAAKAAVRGYRIGRRSIMDKWVCTICGYVYDPAKGDKESGVKPGTSFEALPDDWVCPDCGAPKSDFEKV
jgi:rubredoxin